MTPEERAAQVELAEAREAVEREGGCVEVRDGRLVEHRCPPWWRRAWR